ncbi:MAG: DNA repair protein RadC, partial [Ruminococcus sp.]|nr:DNA repair protein RadC [Ruminococcus sp.]
MADKQEKEKNLHAGHRQRMKQRFIDYGFQGMQQHEILEILLYYAIPRKDTNPLAHRLLDRYGSFAKVCDSPVDELQRDFGMSKSAAVLLKMIPELARTYSETKTLVDHINMKNAPEILRKKFIGATVEKSAIALADSNDRLILCEIIAEGSVS